MTMQTTHNFKGLRNRLIGLSFIILFLSFILFRFIIPDYFVKENALQTDNGIIQNVFKNRYYSYERYRGKVSHPCVDITLVDKSYFIRLSDGLDKKYWAAINDTDNISRRIEVEFQSRLLHDNVLNNPNQISIDNKIIIPFDSKKSFLGWFAIIAGIVDIACIYLFYLSVKTYKANLCLHDNDIG
jgi:hypothetical protein